MGDAGLERFRVELERQVDAMKKSRASEVRLRQRCFELNAEIVALAAQESGATATKDDVVLPTGMFRIFLILIRFCFLSFLKFLILGARRQLKILSKRLRYRINSLLFIFGGRCTY